MKKLFAFAIVFALGSAALFAQEITDEQFTKFAKAFQTVQQANNGAQQEMATLIEGEGLTTQRFNEIHQATLTSETKSDATAKKKKKYESALAKLEMMNKDLQLQMEEKIKAAGMSMETYQKIAQKVQSDPAMQQRLMTYFQGQGQ